MLMLSSARMLLVAVAVFVILVFSFGSSPLRTTTWPSAYGPAVASQDDPYQHKYHHDDKHNGVLNDVQPNTTSHADATTEEMTSLTQEAHTSKPPVMKPDEGASSIHWDASAYIGVSSRMTEDKRWFSIDFGDHDSYNPNLIPHPWKNDTWVMIAQGLQAAGEVKGVIYSLELVCDATYRDGKMQCLRSPTSLPIASTVSDHCTDELDLFNSFIGPNDPRVFFGPDKPYITYGSASHYTCLGQWIHDLRRLVN